MRRFQYRALLPNGSEIVGELLAANGRDAAARLQASGTYPIELTEPSGRRVARGRFTIHSGRIPPRELITFTQQLSILIGAGVPTDRALSLIGAGRRKTAGRQLAAELAAAVNRGESLSQACGGHPSLPRHYALFLAAGEAHGDVGGALERLALVLEKSRATIRALLDALLYPASVVVVAGCSILFLLGFVLPKFQVLMTSFQREPPLAMRWLLAASDVVGQLALPAAVVAVGSIAYVMLRHRDPRFRLALHRRLFALPVLGAILGRIEAERLLYLLGNLVSAGVQLPAAVAVTRAAMASETFRGGLALTQQAIERGDGIATAMAAGGFLPEMVMELVRVGEETDRLAPMLLQASEVLRREFEALSAELIGLVTPISILLLGLLVGGVAVAILDTVMQVYDLAT